MEKKFWRAAAMAAASALVISGLGGCALAERIGSFGTSDSEYVLEDSSEASSDELSGDVERTLISSETGTEDETPLIYQAAEGILQTEDETESENYFVVPDTESESTGRGRTDTGNVSPGDAASDDTVSYTDETESAGAYNESGGPVDLILENVITSRESLGEKWSVGYEDLQTGEKYGYHENEVMQSASVVKLFIMGAVYRYMCYPPSDDEMINFNEEYDGQLRDTISSMITVSDNDAANLLVERLGGGDFQAGAQVVNRFCRDSGYTETSVGRRFMESQPSGDNYTSAADTEKILSDIYHGTLINEEASGKMLQFLKDQTRKNKIPAGLPDGFTSANKTGEMPAGYGLGCIENDAAIVFAPDGMGEGYILTVLSNDLGGRNSEAVNAIVNISSVTAQWYVNEHS